MNAIMEFLDGRKTYVIAAVSIVYLAVCQFTKHEPSTEIMGILGAAGLAALRAGVAKSGPTPPDAK